MWSDFCWNKTTTLSKVRAHRRPSHPRCSWFSTNHLFWLHTFHSTKKGKSLFISCSLTSLVSTTKGWPCADHRWSPRVCTAHINQFRWLPTTNAQKIQLFHYIIHTFISLSHHSLFLSEKGLLQQPAACLGVFRYLTALSKHYILRLLFIEGPFPMSKIHAWRSYTAISEHSEALAEVAGKFFFFFLFSSHDSGSYEVCY